DLLFQISVDGEDLPGGVHIELPGGGEGDGVGGSVEDGGAQVVLRVFDHLAQGGLGDEQFPGGSRDAPLIQNGQYGLNVLVVHRHSSLGNSITILLQDGPKWNKNISTDLWRL